MALPNARTSDPSKVMCSGVGLRFGYINHPIEALVDTRHAGAGELTVFCEGPERKAYCQLKDHHNGTFSIVINPQDVGLHSLHVQYNGVEVTESPFRLRVSPAGFVKLSGSGLQDSLIDKSSGHFMVDAQEAGVGEVKVKIGGPKGFFNIETQKINRQVHCRYHPHHPGIYEIHVLWSGDHVPGSPFQVYLCRTEKELRHHLAVTSSPGQRSRRNQDIGSLYGSDAIR